MPYIISVANASRRTVLEQSIAQSILLDSREWVSIYHEYDHRWKWSRLTRAVVSYGRRKFSLWNCSHRVSSRFGMDPLAVFSQAGVSWRLSVSAPETAFPNVAYGELHYLLCCTACNTRCGGNVGWRKKVREKKSKNIIKLEAVERYIHYFLSSLIISNA